MTRLLSVQRSLSLVCVCVCVCLSVCVFVALVLSAVNSPQDYIKQIGDKELAWQDEREDLRRKVSCLFSCFTVRLRPTYTCTLCVTHIPPSLPSSLPPSLPPHLSLILSTQFEAQQQDFNSQLHKLKYQVRVYL